ncbi:MAG TPA: hypothetical protein VHL56_08040 [Candidatus Limnocylindrales bacterium]|nr:hypothetical protein [Candidatus Limnocylindrales bacterium]
MNPTRDPDRKLSAWLELMPDEAPDRTLAAIQQAVETTPQVRRDLLPAMRRFLQMNRLTYAAAAAVTVAVLAGGAILLKPSSGTGSHGTPSPTAIPTASAASAAAPEALRATWLAAGADTSATGPSSLVRLGTGAAGMRFTLSSKGVTTFASTIAAGPPDELDLVAADTTGGCQVGDLGRYHFTLAADGTVPGSDGMQLTLVAVADACAARSAAFGRTWLRAIDAAGNGGRGVANAFSPMFLMTLPVAGYNADPGMDSLTLSSDKDRTFIAVKNPVGWTEPCSPKGGAHLAVAPTIKAFTAYMKTLPGFTVQSEALTIDGHPAVHLTVPSTVTADCSGGRVNEWTAAADTGSGGWLLRQGETDVLYLVEVDGDLILLQWLGGNVTPAEEQSLFATMHFTDTLPR